MSKRGVSTSTKAITITPKTSLPPLPYNAARQPPAPLQSTPTTTLQYSNNTNAPNATPSLVPSTATTPTRATPSTATVPTSVRAAASMEEGEVVLAEGRGSESTLNSSSSNSTASTTTKGLTDHSQALIDNVLKATTTAPPQQQRQMQRHSRTSNCCSR